MLAGPIATSVVLLLLQLAAFRRHEHVSFLLLAVSTTCGLLYIATALLRYWLGPSAIDAWLYYLLPIFLSGQMVLGIWGVVALFRSYRDLSAAADLSRNHSGDGA
jgi:hypothetical protein